MEIEEIIDIIKVDFDCEDEGLDWQERKYEFQKNTNEVFDIAVNNVILPNVDNIFLNFDEIFINSKGDAVLGEVKRENIESFEIIKK